MSDETKKRIGRPPGSLTKRSWNLRRELEDAGFEPVAEMIAILQQTDDPDKKWDRIKWLFKHLYPQLADVEHLPEPAPPDEKAASTRSTEALLSIANRT